MDHRCGSSHGELRGRHREGLGRRVARGFAVVAKVWHPSELWVSPALRTPDDSAASRPAAAAQIPSREERAWWINAVARCERLERPSACKHLIEAALVHVEGLRSATRIPPPHQFAVYGATHQWHHRLYSRSRGSAAAKCPAIRISSATFDRNGLNALLGRGCLLGHSRAVT